MHKSLVQTNIFMHVSLAMQCELGGGGGGGSVRGYFVLFAIYSGGDSVLVVIYSGGDSVLVAFPTGGCFVLVYKKQWGGFCPGGISSGYQK